MLYKFTIHQKLVVAKSWMAKIRQTLFLGQEANQPLDITKKVLVTEAKFSTLEVAECFYLKQKGVA
jgi:hypothetical protein